MAGAVLLWPGEDVMTAPEMALPATMTALAIGAGCGELLGVSGATVVLGLL